MSEKDGGPAFPSHGSMGEVVQNGMTLRDWYAGQALSKLANSLSDYDSRTVRQCYALADGMLEARKQ